MKKILEVIDKIDLKCIIYFCLVYLFSLYFEFTCIKYQIGTFDRIFTVLSLCFSISLFNKVILYIKNK